MSRHLHLLALCMLAGLAACKRPLTAGAESEGGLHTAATDEASVSVAPEPAPATEAALAPTASAPSGPTTLPVTIEERKRVVAALLSGGYRTSALPESATDVGRPFDRGLRKRLTEVDVTPARADVQVATATPTVPIADVDRVLASLRARFRQCVRKEQVDALDAPRSANGSLAITFVVDEKGEVTSASTSGNTGVPDATVHCVVTTLRRAVFTAPKSASTVTVRLRFSGEQ